jgi:hypothetical protein
MAEKGNVPKEIAMGCKEVLSVGCVWIGVVAAPTWSAHPGGEAPTTRPEALKEIVRSFRSPWGDGVRVTFHAIDVGDAAGVATQTLRWSRDGVALEHGSPVFLVNSYDRATGRSALFDGGETFESADPERVQFGTVAAAYEFAMGVFPTRDVAGRPPFQNDLMAMLEDPGVVILPETREIRGLDCVVVELTRAGRTGAASPILRGHYAPALGYAQVRMEFLSGDGCIVSAWDSSDFVQALPGATALPLRADFASGPCEPGAPVHQVVEVAMDSEGNPEIAVGERAATLWVAPPGSWIVDLDSGGRRVQAPVELEGPAVGAALGAAATESARWWWGAALAAVAIAGAATVAWSRRKSIRIPV